MLLLNIVTKCFTQKQIKRVSAPQTNTPEQVRKKHVTEGNRQMMRYCRWLATLQTFGTVSDTGRKPKKKKKNPKNSVHFYFNTEHASRRVEFILQKNKFLAQIHSPASRELSLFWPHDGSETSWEG